MPKRIAPLSETQVRNAKPKDKEYKLMDGRAYNRTSHLAERKKMMQQWADYLDGLKSGAKVIPLRDQKSA